MTLTPIVYILLVIIGTLSAKLVYLQGEYNSIQSKISILEQQMGLHQNLLAKIETTNYLLSHNVSLGNNSTSWVFWVLAAVTAASIIAFSIYTFSGSSEAPLNLINNQNIELSQHVTESLNVILKSLEDIKTGNQLSHEALLDNLLLIESLLKNLKDPSVAQIQFLNETARVVSSLPLVPGL